MSLKARIITDMKTAMKARQKDVLGTIRMLTAAIKQVEVDDRKELSDEDIVSIVGKMIKQRKDAAEQYEKADRADLQNTELAEIEILKNYLPTQLTVEEVSVVISTIISETGASGMQDMGKVMGLAKAKIAGQADMSVVSQHVKALLSQTAS